MDWPQMTLSAVTILGVIFTGVLQIISAIRAMRLETKMEAVKNTVQNVTEKVDQGIKATNGNLTVLIEQTKDASLAKGILQGRKEEAANPTLLPPHQPQ
jgi:hypothetical protein